MRRANSVIDVTGRVPATQLGLLGEISTVARLKHLDLLLIGAIARDFITLHRWGASAGRGTNDMEFAVAMVQGHRPGSLGAQILERARQRLRALHRGLMGR